MTFKMLKKTKDNSTESIEAYASESGFFSRVHYLKQSKLL